ncbi:MAG TPA: tetratricopeptide repeat protein [Myxococcota bacterium]|nr:tetratricopeptide repeat protein [Myxococcota bacterium]HRY96040.1 tetratricopeptide repeat protein [Myxococcota bacterium]
MRAVHLAKAAALLGLAAALPAGPLQAQPASPPIVAVFVLEDTRPAKVRLSERERVDLTAYLSNALVEGGAYRVVPPERLRAVLLEKKKESYRACVDERCQIEIGQEVAAQKTLVTRVIQVGAQCAIIGTLFDLEQAAAERASTHKGACGRDKLFEGLEALAKGLQGGGAKSVAGLPTEADSLEAERLYKEGLAALEKGDADLALQRFQAVELAGFADWRLANDLYHQWGEVHRNQKNDPARALEKLQRCVDVSQDPTEWPAPWCEYLLGTLAWSQGNTDRAIALFESAWAHLGKAEWVYKNDVLHSLGEAYRIARKDQAKAIAFHQQALDVSLDKTDWPAPWSQYILGIIAWERQDADRAIALYGQALTLLAPHSWAYKNDVYHMLGEAYRVLKKDPAKAAEYHRQVVGISADPTDWPAPWSQYLLGVLAQERGDADAAIALYDQALGYLAPHLPIYKNDVLFMLGEVYRNLKKNPGKAAGYHQQAVAISPDKTEWPAPWSQYILGILAQERGDADAAIALYDQALVYLAPHPPIYKNDVLYMLGELHRNLKKDPARSAEYFQQAVDISPDKTDWPAPWSQYMAGVVAHEQGNADRAIALYSQALVYLAPHPGIYKNDVLFNLGEVYRNLKKDPGKAAEYHQQAVDVSPDKTDWPTPWSQYILGWMAWEQDNPDRAITLETLALTYLEPHPWIYKNDVRWVIGEAYRDGKHDPAGALPHYQACVTISQDLADWPAYWCLLRQAEILRDRGQKGLAAEQLLRAETAGKAEPGFLQEVDRVLRASGMR